MIALGKKTWPRYWSACEHLVDEKRRLQIPAKWLPPEDLRDLDHLLMLWQLSGQERPCLLALSPPAFEALEQKMSAMAFADPKAESLRRLITYDSEIVRPDGAGRICLPQRFVDEAGIKRKAMLVGMGDRFQIWDPEYYQVIRRQDIARKQEAIQLI